MNLALPNNRFSHLRLFAIVAAWFVCLFLPASATADLSPEEMERLEEHISSAADATDRGDYRRAVEDWAAAAEMVDHPRIQLHLGSAHAHLDECTQAQKIYDELARRDDLDDEIRDEHRQLGRQVRDCSEPGDIRVDCTPDDLTLEVDDQDWACSQWREVEPGTYRGTATRQGYEAQPVEFHIDDGERLEETVVLREELELDDRSDPILYAGVGTAGLGALFLGVGAVRDNRSSARAEEMMAAREAGDQGRMDELRDDADSARRITMLSYGVGAAALATGAGLTLYSLFRSNDEDEPPRLGLGVSPTGLEVEVRFR